MFLFCSKWKRVLKFLHLDELKNNAHLQHSVTGEPHVVSKNERELCCRKFYPNQFWTKVYPQKHQKSLRYMQETDFR